MLDHIDIQIIDILQKNSRIQKIDIARKLGFTIPSITTRIQKLEDSGVIEGYHMKVNNKAIGKDILAYVFVFMSPSTHRKEFTDKVKDMNDILECYSITGEGSFLIKIAADGVLFLEKILSEIRSFDCVVSTKSHIVLSTCKEFTAIKPSRSVLK